MYGLHIYYTKWTFSLLAITCSQCGVIERGYVGVIESDW